MWIFILKEPMQSSLHLDFNESIWNSVQNIPSYVDDFVKSFLIEVIEDAQLKEKIINLEVGEYFETPSGVKGVRQA